MPNTGDDTGLLWKVSLAVWTFFGGVIAWIMGRLDRKVSKDVYKEFKDRNDQQHGVTHSALKDINDELKGIKESDQEAHSKIYNKIDGKKDKD